MIAELLVVVTLGVVGWVLLPTWLDDPIARVAAALPLGAAAFVTAQLLLLAAVPAIAAPRTVLAVVAGGAVGVGVVRRQAQQWRRGLRALAPGVGVAALVVATVVAVPVANVTADSFRYVTLASLLSMGDGAQRASWFLLQSRGLAMGALHGLAPLDPGYLRSIGPLLGLSTLALVWSAVRAELTPRLGGRAGWLVATLAAVLLATNSRFVFTSFYVNGHVEFAVWLLLLVAAGRAVVAAPTRATWPTAALVGLVGVALTVLRPEGVLVALLALTPMVVAAELPERWRGAVLAVVGVGSVVWHAAVLWPRGDEFNVEVAGLAGLGLVLVLVGATVEVADRLLARRPLGHVPVLVQAHALLWLITLAWGVTDAATLRRSVVATVRNVTSDGLWGSSLWLLGAMVVVGLALVSVDRVGTLLFPLASFVPLGLLLALLRGGGYRFGPGDSLNRMLVHVVPLAVVLVGAMAAGAPTARARRLRRWWRADVPDSARR